MWLCRSLWQRRGGCHTRWHFCACRAGWTGAYACASAAHQRAHVSFAVPGGCAGSLDLAPLDMAIVTAAASGRATDREARQLWRGPLDA